MRVVSYHFRPKPISLSVTNKFDWTSCSKLGTEEQSKAFLATATYTAPLTN